MRLSRPQPNAYTLWLYLLSCPLSTNVPGIFRAGEAALAEDLGWELEAFRKVFLEVIREGLAKYDAAARVVWLPNAIKYNTPESPNVVKSWRNPWDEIPECALKNEAWRVLKVFVEDIGEGFAKAFAKACPKPLANQEQKQEQEQQKETGTDSSPTNGLSASESAQRNTAGARVAEPEPPEFAATHLGIDMVLLAAAHARFPHLTGRRQVVAYAWAAAKSSGPPRGLDALDHLGGVPLVKILAHLGHYLTTQPAQFHSFPRFVETFGDHDPDAPGTQAVDARGRPLRGSMSAIQRVGQDLGVLP